MADPVGFDEVRSNPSFLVRWRPFTTSLAVLTRFDSVESYFFFPSYFFFFFFPSSFFFFPLPIFKSWDGFSPWKSPLFTYHSFFFFPSFPLFYTSFFPSFIVLLQFLPPTFPLPSILFFSHFLLTILVCFFSSPVHHHNSSITDKCH